MKKTVYSAPEAEVIGAILRSDILDASGDANRDGYGEGGEFNW